MAYQTGDLGATLSAAAGDDAELFAELRGAFIDSALRQADLLRRSRCDGNWRVAALRLKGLAGSFRADDLMELADRALVSAPGDPYIVRKIQAFLDEYGAA